MPADKASGSGNGHGSAQGRVEGGQRCRPYPGVWCLGDRGDGLGFGKDTLGAMAIDRAHSDRRLGGNPDWRRLPHEDRQGQKTCGGNASFGTDINVRAAFLGFLLGFGAPGGI